MTWTVTVANLKGGTAKTTTAAYLAHCLGPNVLAVDADPGGSLLSWSERGEWELPVVGLASKTLHRSLPRFADGYDRVVIDTPPVEEHGGIAASALRAADVVVVPIAPSSMELDRLGPILAMLEDVEPLVARPPLVRVLLTRVVARTNSAANTRQVLTDAGLEVLPTAIPRLEKYALAFGKPVETHPFDAYWRAAQELLASVEGVTA